MANLVKVNALSYAHMIAMLLDDDYSCRELAKATGLHYITVCYYLRELHKAGAVYVADFRTDRLGRRTTKSYRVGKKRDAVAQPISGTEKSRRYRSRIASLERIWTRSAGA